MATILDLNEVLLSDEKFNTLFNTLKDNILNKFTEGYNLELVKVSVNDEEFEINNGNLFTTLMLNKTFNDFKREIDSSLLIKPDDIIDEDLISNHINQIMTQFEDIKGNDELFDSISETLRLMDEVSGKVNILHGNTMNLYSLIELSDENEEFNDLLHTDVEKENMQFNEIEDYISDRKDRAMEILSESNNVYSNYINSKTGINPDQLGQVIINIGLKPDLEGIVIPDPVNTNFLNGYRNVRDFYINSLGARKASIINYSKVRDSGLSA